jgi:8-oxo-dGTP diphosphatase
MSDAVQFGVVVVVHRQGRYLVIQRAPGVIVPGAWCFVGGAIEPGETQPEAVVREFAEEVGGRVRPVRLLWEYTRPDGRLHLYWWLAELEGMQLEANPAEVSDMRWLTPDGIEALPEVLDSNRAFLAEVGRALLDDAAGA